MLPPGWNELIDRAVEFLAGVPEFIWDGRSLPVPIEAIADSHLGLLVREVSDLGSAPGLPASKRGTQISGLLLPDRREIWVNAEEAARWPRRRRYTIAHEIGHWIIHANGRAAIHCRADRVTPVPIPLTLPSDTPVAPSHAALFDDGVTELGFWSRDPLDTEDEANIFGGALLMPPRLIRRIYDTSGGDLERVADAFDCSLSAVRGRWQHYYQYRAS